MKVGTITYCGRSAHLLASHKRIKETMYIVMNIALLSMTLTLGFLGLAIMGE